MAESVPTPNVVRFGAFEVDLRARELRKSGVRRKLGGQPFQVLAILLERPGDLVTREELHKRLWTDDTFVDFEHGLNAIVNRLREVLGDSSDSPRFIETVPRRGYRFIAPVMDTGVSKREEGAALRSQRNVRGRVLRHRAFVAGMVLLLAGALFLVTRKPHATAPATPRPLSRLTFDDGLQLGATWSQDGNFVAYSSNRGGKFDIWVQQVDAGDAIQITRGPGHNWQPDWSPDGKYIVYRSEQGGGGLFVIPALGGAGSERRIVSFGYHPRWSPDGSQILFQTTQFLGMNRFFVVAPDGGQPHEVLAQFKARDGPSALSAAWHPDGRRLSVWIWNNSYSPNFWTVPIAGGTSVKSELTAEVGQELAALAAERGIEWAKDFTFAWAPSGRAIYCVLTLRGVSNLWKMTVDPATLRVTAAERVTTGPGPDSSLALSRDGRKLSFTAEAQQIRGGLFPLDAVQGRLSGAGQPVTPAGITTWRQTLSPDCRSLTFAGVHAGRFEFLRMSMPALQTEPIVTDGVQRDYAQWSHDGKHVVYTRVDASQAQLFEWSAETAEEHPMTSGRDLDITAYDWSADDKSLLVEQMNNETHHLEIWQLPVTAAPHAEISGRRLIADAAHDVANPHFSPDGRWIVFQRVRDLPTGLESTLMVTPASGGSWAPVTEGRYWDDKPRWSFDGKTIYFLSGRGGFFNLWGIHFDPVKGNTVGPAFAVTTFASPSLMLPEHIPSLEPSITRDRLALTVESVSGSIWILEGMGPG